MRINSIGIKFQKPSKNPNFRGDLIILKTLSEIKPSAIEKAAKNFDDEISWINWMSLKIKHYSKTNRTKTSSSKNLFQSVSETFDSKDNKKFLDELFRNSPDEASLYKKKFYQLLRQFQGAGVSSKECENLKGGLDFIEEVSKYAPDENLYLKKTGMGFPANQPRRYPAGPRK